MNVSGSKDSAIIDDDIDLILASGREKTKELNEKLLDADKGDMLDFKIDDACFIICVEVDVQLRNTMKTN